MVTRTRVVGPGCRQRMIHVRMSHSRRGDQHDSIVNEQPCLSERRELLPRRALTPSSTPTITTLLHGHLGGRHRLPFPP